MSDQITVSSLDPRDERGAAEVLTRAFHDDPLWVALVPDAMRRERLARLLFERVMQHALQWGDCYGAWRERQLVGTALWLPPGSPGLGRGRRMAFGLAWRTYRILGWRAASVAQAFAEIERRRPTRPHWFLSFMGVEAGSRGMGAGTRMLTAAMARVDADGLPAYLETFNEQSLALYRRAGFELSGELRLGRNLPTGWQLWRPGRLGLT